MKRNTRKDYPFPGMKTGDEEHKPSDGIIKEEEEFPDVQMGISGRTITACFKTVEVDMTFRQLQDEQKPWVEHNFPGRDKYYPLLGVQEEVGELAHAHLKGLQGIRTNEDHDAMGQDAVGDIVIFLADYCTAMGWDMQECVEKTWEQVQKRDWKKDPVKGGTNE